MNYKKYCKFRPCTLISLSIILILNIISINGDSVSHQGVLDDLPRASDLNRYLIILERAVDFCLENKHGVDMSLDFGLFLVGVTLNQVLTEKRQKLPPDVVFRLEQLLLKYGEIKDYFNVHVKKGLLSEYGHSARITDLVYNISSWQLPLEYFDLELLKRTKVLDDDELNDLYGPWDAYIRTVTNYMDFKPSLEDSGNVFCWSIHP
uniref:SFRICE_038416 n=1 Tax=Spodoptera frugiperda TaxID=7108 RepID=A0A2H1WEA8_SPOFR